MKRPPGLWLLLSAGVLWLSVQNVYGIKATSLIFGKPSTTTTSPEAAGEEGSNSDSESGEVVVTTTESANSTGKPTNLTGIPQIDYIWDPNLPRELNGYNLSDYPFYDRVPEDIDFKCDGLHDGFYASVPHKCQVYHHCLFGTRYDFLCANYTAFDQKTFICHFVSEVDCVNSKKFWHRNDALYQAASTTTIKPTFVYTPPAQPPPFFTNTATSASNLQPQPQPPPPAADVSQSHPNAQPQPQLPPQPPPRRSSGGRQRPRPRPRRPQYDYYDDYEDYYETDYYEEPRSRGRRKRPRPRPRPVYDDEYEDEYDVGRRRRPGRRPYRGYDDRRPMRRRNKNGDRRPYDDFEDEYEDDSPRYNRRNENRRKNRNEESTKPSNKKNVRPVEDDTIDEHDRSRKGIKRPTPTDDYYDDEKPVKDEKRPYDRRRSNSDDDKKIAPEDAPLIKPSGISSIYNRPRAAPKVRPPVPKNEQEKFAYKPMSSTEPPQLSKDASSEEEYYDDYEEELPVKKQPTALANRKPETEPRRPFFKPSASGREEVKDKTDGMASRPRGYAPKRPQDDEDEEIERPNFRRPFKRPKYGSDKDGRYGSTNRNRPSVVDEYYDEEEEEEKIVAKDKSKKGKDHLQESTAVTTTSTTTTEAPLPSSPSTTTTTTTTTSTTTTTVAPLTTALPKERHEGVVRVVKRPFLPSRGGSPYTSRGLQPIGTKAAEPEKPDKIEVSTPFISIKTDTSEELPLEYEDDEFEDEEELLEKEVQQEVKHSTFTTTAVPMEQKRTEAPFKPSPVLLKVNVNVRPKSTTTTPQPITEEVKEAVIKSVSPRLPPFKTLIRSESKAPALESKTTEKPKPLEPNPLDINENEYDVTLNEALNPTLPNLPLRAFPTGFGASSSDAPFRNLHRNGPRYVVEGLAQESSDYTYQIKEPTQRFDAIPIYNSGGGAQFVNSNADYQGQFSQFRPSYHRPNSRITQTQTRAFYHGI